MWGRMWSSGRSSDGGENPKSELCVRADGARKRAARRWTNQGLEPPASLLRRETDNYDRLHGRTPSSAAGSSSAATSSSTAALLPVKKEWADEPEDRELVAVKKEPAEIARQGIVGPEDFVCDDVDAVATAIDERILREDAVRHRQDEELEDLMLKQAVAASSTMKEKEDEWRRIREEVRMKLIDLVCYD
ncbi:ABC transporter B family member 25 [Hordeum vulgare]|nr:ABC transporter B family member 25 [Hordeum vulgare]